MLRLSLCICFLFTISTSVFSARPDAHAPIGVMGEHIHKKGEWMVSYRYMTMKMNGNRSGTDRVSDASQLRPNGGSYMVIPQRMDMNMHMIGAMYASSDQVTWMAMLPFVDLSMDHLVMNGNEFTTETNDIGDVKLSALVLMHKTESSEWLLNAGLSIPTGTIDATDVTPMSAPNEAQLPYPMQTSSGTYDLMPGVTFNSRQDDTSWGAQLRAVIRTGENDRDYTLGHRYQLTSWYSIVLNKHWSWSTRVNLEAWEDIEGADPDLMMALVNQVVPTADPSLRNGRRADLGVGLNYISGGQLPHRFAIEVMQPAYQDLSGPQLETDLIVTAGWQWAF